MSTGTNHISEKPTILIIDDEAGPRDALKVILRPLFQIRSAENAKMALAILSQEPIDLVTLDQRLPDCQGIDLLQEIRQKHPAIQVIIITGYGSLKSAMEGIRHGAAGYLLKPFNVTELTTLIQQTLEKKNRLAFLHHALETSPDLWESGDRGIRAWETVKSGYANFQTHSPGQDSDQYHEIDLLPLVSDLLEVTDKHLLNHSSRVSLYAPLLANRLDLSEKEEKEIVVLQSYLPTQLTAEQLAAEVGKAIAEAGAKSVKDLGNVMKIITPRLKGQAEGKAISDEVKAQLTKLGA